MKIFVAGATGAIGKRLVPLLVNWGHTVTGTTRTPDKASTLRSMGAEPIILDVLDRDAVMRAVVAAHPNVVVSQVTSLASARNLKHFDKEFTMTNRLRTEGTDHLLAAAHEAGAQRFLAQSYAGWPAGREGGRIKTEEDPFDPNPPKTMRQSLEAIRRQEETVKNCRNLTGVVLRYGSLYGPGTSTAPGGDLLEAVRKRQLPIVGGGGGVWSFLHVDDAADATLLAIEGGPGGVYNIVDDEPAEVSEWLPDMARAIGAPPPYRVPAWIGRLIVGEAIVLMMTQVRGASNAKAKRLLHWQPRYASWRQGFREGFDPALPESQPAKGEAPKKDLRFI